MNYFARVIILTITALFLLSCSADETESDLVKIEVPTPLVILVDRDILIDLGNTISTITLTAPWSVVNFRSVNNSTRIITVLGGSYIVTDPLTGQQKVIALTSLEGDFNYEGVIFPSRDTDCDGVVSDAEAAAGVGPAIPCDRLRTEPCPEGDICTPSDLAPGNSIAVSLLDERQFFLENMGNAGSGASGIGIDQSVAQLYRGLAFQVEASIEGWFGSPDRPEANFFRQFFFTTKAN